MTPDVDLVNGYKISRSDPLHRIIIGRLYHHIVNVLFGLTVRDVDCDFRLMRRDDLRTRQSGKDQRRHLPRDDEEDPGRRLPDRRSARPSLPPRLRQVAVLQRPADRQDRRRRPAAVVRARDPPSASAPDVRPLVARGDAADRAFRARSGRDRGLSRLLSRPRGDDHRRTRVHRQQPRAPAGGARRRRAARRLAHPRLRRQPRSTSTASPTASASTSPTSVSRAR